MPNTGQQVAIFWFRRDLRLADNHGLHVALTSGLPVLPLFIFDSTILDKLENKADPRVEFIHNALSEIHDGCLQNGSSLLIQQGHPLDVWQQLIKEYEVAAVYANHDYEPYARERDAQIGRLLKEHGIALQTFKDQVIFEKSEVMKDSGDPYTVYTPYRKRWERQLRSRHLGHQPSERHLDKLWKMEPFPLPMLMEIGFTESGMQFPGRALREEIVMKYDQQRDFPAVDGTSRLSVHLRFGTVSTRQLVKRALELNEVWLSELIWREFFMMILWHFPHVVGKAFKQKYEAVPWRQDEADFKRWCTGETGYPMVDAGMRELNNTGFMHNRVRMVAASFLTKHLLLDWRWGEAYFAEKLLDFDLSANNGNWQWAAGCGCDAAPYFRVFNPTTQIQKFDGQHEYIKRWVPELNSLDYPMPMVEHRFARQRALDAYKSALQ